MRGHLRKYGNNKRGMIHKAENIILQGHKPQYPSSITGLDYLAVRVYPADYICPHCAPVSSYASLHTNHSTLPALLDLIT
jgi:hypothetical protein